MTNIPSEKPEWFKDHEDKEREQMPILVEAALVSFFEKKGAMGKNIIVTTAMILSSIIAIFIGLKTILGWLGISIMTKP